MFFTNWLHSVQHGLQLRRRPMRRRTERRTHVAAEVCEQRTVMSANVIATLSGDGVLTVTGTDRRDAITVQQVNGKLSIQGVQVNVNGHLVNSVDASAVKGIQIDGLGGNDRITFLEMGRARQAITIDATINGERAMTSSRLVPAMI